MGPLAATASAAKDFVVFLSSGQKALFEQDGRELVPLKRLEFWPYGDTLVFEQQNKAIIEEVLLSKRGKRKKFHFSFEFHSFFLPKSHLSILNGSTCGIKR